MYDKAFLCERNRTVCFNCFFIEGDLKKKKMTILELFLTAVIA